MPHRMFLQAFLRSSTKLIQLLLSNVYFGVFLLKRLFSSAKCFQVHFFSNSEICEISLVPSKFDFFSERTQELSSGAFQEHPSDG